MDELLKRLWELAWNWYATVSQYIALMQQIVEAEKKAAVDEAEIVIKESANPTKYGGRFWRKEAQP
jgi:hypothetical protein